VAKGAVVLEAAVKEYLYNGPGAGFQALCVEIDNLEGQADKIKRRIRNHLPRDLFLEVDKTLFLNFTRSQDNILDSAQEALNWLGIRRLDLAGDLTSAAHLLAREACRTVEILKPAITGTMELVYGENRDRGQAKNNYREVRLQHHRVTRLSRKLKREAFSADSDFREIYRFLKFIEYLHDMSHNAEGAADVLRAMIAR
jgi:hypothetical protein